MRGVSARTGKSGSSRKYPSTSWGAILSSGAGKPTAKRIEEIADVFAFTMHNLGATNVALVP